MIPLLFALPLAAQVDIPNDFECEVVGVIIESGDPTFTDQDPVEGFTISLLCPQTTRTVTASGVLTTKTEIIPLFIELDDEQSKVLLEAAEDLVASDDVFLDDGK
jgi:hypothetical protein